MAKLKTRGGWSRSRIERRATTDEFAEWDHCIRIMGPLHTNKVTMTRAETHERKPGDDLWQQGLKDMIPPV